MSKRIKTNKSFKTKKRRVGFKEEKQFKRLKNEILKDRQCSNCGKCCNSFKIKLTQRDLDVEPRLMKYVIPMSKNMIKRHKGISDIDYVGILKSANKNSQRCVFYNEGIGCKIHSTKPAECVAYTPSLGHCKHTEIRDYCNLEAYFNACQKKYTEEAKSCGGENKVQKLKILINSFILPFITECDANGFKEPNYNGPIPLFIRESLEMDGSYKVVKDLPMIEYSFELYKKCK